MNSSSTRPVPETAPPDGTTKTTAAAPVDATSERPAQDEWGLYDPEQCGFAALRQRLERLAQAQADERERRERSAIMRR